MRRVDAGVSVLVDGVPQEEFSKFAAEFLGRAYTREGEPVICRVEMVSDDGIAGTVFVAMDDTAWHAIGVSVRQAAALLEEKGIALRRRAVVLKLAAIAAFVAAAWALADLVSYLLAA